MKLDKDKNIIKDKIFDKRQELLWNFERSTALAKKEIRKLENKVSNINEQQANIPECMKECIKNNIKKSAISKLKKECLYENNMKYCEEYFKENKQIQNIFDKYDEIRKLEDRKEIFHE